jgi:hypothetical protein
MAKASVATHGLTTASAADLIEGSPQPEERTLIDACRTPFAFGVVTLIPFALIVGAFLYLALWRPPFVQHLLAIASVQDRAR